MNKRAIFLLLITVLAFCSCHKEEQPLRVRYQNLSGQYLKAIQVVNYSGDTFNLEDLAPGDCSDYVYIDEVTIYNGRIPGQSMNGLTKDGRFEASMFFDCLTGFEIENLTKGDLTFGIKPSWFNFSTIPSNTTHLMLEMKVEAVWPLNSPGCQRFTHLNVGPCGCPLCQ